ncbi:hypothetical protein NDU88_000829 [Pleurodeles waltl]|uniref:Uncharacterized protein n=1 Tax=Pleurodeles waltl TaxID=8319 RepID=A0AAV7LVV6_PLEWA|nr:hypothetical protein NDU88_000829 [Pleurodeles waltl]
MRGCVRGSSPSPPAVLGSLRNCAQGAAAGIVGPLGSSLERIRISLPSGPWVNRCVACRAATFRDVLLGHINGETFEVHSHDLQGSQMTLEDSSDTMTYGSHIVEGGGEKGIAINPGTMKSMPFKALVGELSSAIVLNMT